MNTHGCRLSPSVAGGSDESYHTPRLQTIRRAARARACYVATIYQRRSHVKDNVSRQTYPFNLPDLPYAYDALEPHIDAKHHAHSSSRASRHLREEAQRSIVEGTAQLQKLTLAELLRDADKLPEAIRTAVKNNGGGHLNHDLFWRSMAPAHVSREPRGELGDSAGARISAPSKRFARSSATRPRNISRAAGSRSSLEHATKKLAIVELKDHEVVQRSRCHRDLHPRRLGARVLREISESAARNSSTRSGTSSTGRRPRKDSIDAAQPRGV